MGIAPQFENDLFISYSHLDNAAAGESDGWVTTFVAHLETALKQRLGRAGATLRVFFDKRATGANYQLDELLATVRRSALFLAIGSPSYVTSEWPCHEVDEFVGQVPDRARLFIIECLPLDATDPYPPSLAGHVRLEFWKPSGRRQIPMAISPTEHAHEFATLVHSLAADMKDKLVRMRHTTGAVVTAGAPTLDFVPVASAGLAYAEDAGDSFRTVVVAQPTDDVADETDQLVRYLRQFEPEVKLLPVAGYPQGGEPFAAAFSADLSRASLFVQLLGRHSGRVPPDLPGGYTRFQLDTARRTGVEIMQWRHPDLDPLSVADADYRKILAAETVVASGLEAFKAMVLAWARRPRPRAEKIRASRNVPTVFINADLRDSGVAREIERECLQHAMTTFLPMWGASSESCRQDLEANLTDCDALLFIYGDTSPDWIRSQLRFFGKVKPKRQADPRLVAICSGPPASKPEIGVTMPNAHVISCPEGWDMKSVRALLAGLTA